LSTQLYDALEKACNKRMTLKVSQGHRKLRYSIDHTSLTIIGL